MITKRLELYIRKNCVETSKARTLLPRQIAQTICWLSNDKRKSRLSSWLSQAYYHRAFRPSNFYSSYFLHRQCLYQHRIALEWSRPCQLIREMAYSQRHKRPYWWALTKVRPGSTLMAQWIARLAKVDPSMKWWDWAAKTTARKESPKTLNNSHYKAFLCNTTRYSRRPSLLI